MLNQNSNNQRADNDRGGIRSRERNMNDAKLHMPTLSDLLTVYLSRKKMHLQHSSVVAVKDKFMQK